MTPAFNNNENVAGLQTLQQHKCNFWLELLEVSKSRDSSNSYITEAFTHSMFVIILYIICDRPQDISHFGDDTRTTRSHGKTKDAGVNTE